VPAYFGRSGDATMPCQESDGAPSGRYSLQLHDIERDRRSLTAGSPDFGKIVTAT
jgi:hypothetical protein